eukprot:4898419-Pyramimonas_sp.AAC.1
MHLAAAITRDEMQKGLLPHAGTGAAELTCMALRAIARTVWRQDVRLAHRLRGSSPLAEKYLQIGPDNL